MEKESTETWCTVFHHAQELPKFWILILLNKEQPNSSFLLCDVIALTMWISVNFIPEFQNPLICLSFLSFGLLKSYDKYTFLPQFDIRCHNLYSSVSSSCRYCRYLHHALFVIYLQWFESSDLFLFMGMFVLWKISSVLYIEPLVYAIISPFFIDSYCSLCYYPKVVSLCLYNFFGKFCFYTSFSSINFFTSILIDQGHC